jgi:hypothetical protein
LKSLGQGAELNNDAVALFTEGQLTVDQLMKFSVGLARKADGYAGEILKVDMRHNTMPENKKFAYSNMLTLAQENRRRAIDLALAQQKSKNGSSRTKPTQVS